MKKLIRLLMLTGIMLPVSLLADDTEVYLDETTIEVSRPNVIFVIDSSMAMSEMVMDDTFNLGYITKMEVVKRAVRDFIFNSSNINVGLVEFSNGNANLLQPVRFVDEMVNGVPHRTHLMNSSMMMFPMGAGSMSAALSLAVDHFKNSPTAIVNGCQSNHIVVIGNKAPNFHSPNTASQIQSLIGKSCSSGMFNEMPDIGGFECMDKLVQHISTEDQSLTIEGNQHIIFHGITFNEELPLFNELVKHHPDSRYMFAISSSGIVEAFENIIANIERGASSFVSPGVAVSQSNSIAHDSSLYYAIFQPRGSAVWAGNMKKYALVDGEIVGSNGKSVATGGVFNPETQNFWSRTVDGDKVTIGGAANKFGGTIDEEMLPSRKVYSNFTGNEKVDLTLPANRLSETNTEALNADIVEEPSTEEPDSLQNRLEKLLELIKWARGVDTEDEFKRKGKKDNDDEQKMGETQNMEESDNNARKIMGDSLHSKPTVVSYEGKQVVFSSTNEGYIHALNTETGNEYWSYLPLALLAEIEKVKEKKVTAVRQYGLDGHMVPHIVDENRNGLLDEGEKGYLMIGMRRGGRDYYMLDISDLNKPKLLYIVKGGNGDFTELGQSWSKPIFGYINWNNQPRLVVAFGGGYDPNSQDFYGAPKSDGMGKTVYIIDAETGQKLWDARSHAESPEVGSGGSLKNMVSAFTGDIAAIDLSGSGFIEHIYAIDIQGQIFRFDINNMKNEGRAGSLAVGGRIAQLGGNATRDSRRFYNGVDVASVKRPNGASFLSLSVGSGYRAHPKDLSTSDRFFMVRDMGVLNRYIDENDIIRSQFLQDITTDNLLDITPLLDGTTLADGLQVSIGERIDTDPSLLGWYLDFDQSGTVGEKVLAPAKTFNNKVLFTTYLPATETVSSGSRAQCTMNHGSSRTYVMNVVDGTPSKVGGPRHVENELSGIAPEPNILFIADPKNPNGPPKPTVVIGATTPFDDDEQSSADILGLGAKTLKPRNWEEVSD